MSSYIDLSPDKQVKRTIFMHNEQFIVRFLYSLMTVLKFTDHYSF